MYIKRWVLTIIIALSLSCQAFAYAPSNWAVLHAEKAEELGIGYEAGIEPYDRLLTRKELAYVGVNLYRLLTNTALFLEDLDINQIASQYTDSYVNGRLFDDEVFLAIKYQLMFGTSDSTFSPDVIVTREQTAAVLYRIGEKAGVLGEESLADLTRFIDYESVSSYAYNCISYMVGKDIITGKTADIIAPQDPCTYEQVLSIAVRFYEANKPEEIDSVPVFAEIQQDPEFAPILYSYDWEMDFEFVKGIEIKRYLSNQEAMADMVTITVNVWNLSASGVKTPSTKTLIVHNEVADDVIGIFDEIFAGSQQFPIQAVSGYSWRGAGSKSSHNNGLAIDINPDQNYFIDTEGNVLAGSFWSPYENPYSITPDGDVVRAFENKGWYWGGLGWSTTGNDYMHFSYTGV